MNPDRPRQEASPDWPGVSVSVGPFGLRCASQDEALIARLARRYQDFLQDQPVDFEAGFAITAAPGQTSAHLPDVHFQAGRILIEAAHLQGEIDADLRRGRLQGEAARPLDVIEYYLRLVTAVLAFNRGGMLFHAAAVERHSRACVFFGKSGSGKTTAARNSPAGAVLNDDLVLILPDGPGWRVWSTPFWNPTQVRPRAVSAPLAGLFRLVQDQQVYLEPASYGQALAEVTASIPVITLDPQRSQAALQRAAALLQAVPLRRLHLQANDSYWPVVDAFLNQQSGSIPKI